jgi:hypothetical protein
MFVEKTNENLKREKSVLRMAPKNNDRLKQKREIHKRIALRCSQTTCDVHRSRMQEESAF